LPVAKPHSREHVWKYNVVLKAGSCDITEEPLPEDVLEDLEEKLQEVMESTMENYDLDFQIEESQKVLTDKLDELSGEIVF
jgi:hypothetical protein